LIAHRIPLLSDTRHDRINVVDTFFRAGEMEFFLRLHGLWDWKRSGHRVPQAARRVERQPHQRVIDIPPPPDPPFDIETFEPIEPIEPPLQAIREWIPDDDGEPGGDLFDQRPTSGKGVEISREDGFILVLDGG
jgi:hypothetical protein